MNMRILLLGLVMVLAMLAAATGVADDRLVSVDPTAKVITVESAGVLKLYRVADAAQVTVNGAPSTLPQLLPGQTVVIKSVEPITATKIAASGLARTSPAAQPLALRSVTVQVRIDGGDRIFYKDGNLWVEHMDANKPTDFVINGVAWSPTWNDKKTEPAFTTFTIPVAPIGQGRVAVKQLAGRGKVKLEQTPNAPAMVIIEDGKPGADDYAFQFSW